MRARKSIYLVLGILFIVFDALYTYFVAVVLPGKYHTEAYTIGANISEQWMLVPGLLFLLGAYRVQKKINRKNKEALENAFN